MLRFLLFLAGAFVLSRVLAALPLVGGLFGRGLLGLWLAALLLSFALTRLGSWALERGRERGELRRLGAVDRPHVRGKLGAYLLARGRPGRALAPLEEAARGEPDVAEWPYRLGCARLALRDRKGAVEALRRALALDPEHAFGAARLRLAEALGAAGDHAGALEAAETFERDHGASPESAYRRARAARALGGADAEREARAELEELVRTAPRYQRAEARRWLWRARTGL